LSTRTSARTTAIDIDDGGQVGVSMGIL
jgi:hypothetical protein